MFFVIGGVFSSFYGKERIFMNYIVIDLEWNQADTPENSIADIPFEIMEIGAVKLNEQLEYIDSFHEMISPRLYTSIHRISGEITHLSMDDLQNGKDFKTVAGDFIRWCGDDYMFCTWGPMDLTELQRNMHYYGMSLFPFPVYFYDLQKIFSLIYDDGKIRRSLSYAVDYLKITNDLPFHRAIEDAKYTSRVLKLMDLSVVKSYFSIDNYQIPSSKKEEIFVKYETYSKFVSRGFENRTEILEDKRVITTPCLFCDKKLKKKIRWFSAGAKTYHCLCICPEHGLMKGKIRAKKTDTGLYYAIRTIKPTDDDGAAMISQKQLELRKKRREKRIKK